MDTEHNSETQEIIDLASRIKPIEIGGEKHIRRVALPPDWTLDEYNDENLLAVPARKKGTVRLDEQVSFIDYINRHKIDNLTTIYCLADYTASTVSFNCIINDHKGTKDGQQWRDHVALYAPVFSEEWERWTKNNQEPKSQVGFASFIEQNLEDIAAVDGMPSGTDLLQMAVSFEANQDKRYKSHVRLQNGGIELNMVDNDDAQTLERMKMFEMISIGIPVFWNGDRYRIDARLRYRVNQGELKFWYELIRPDRKMEDATKTMIDKIKLETGVPLYFGKI